MNRAHIVQNVILIWFDPNINKVNDFKIQLQRIIHTIELFIDVD